MIITGPMITAMLQAITTPRDGVYRLHQGKCYLRDKVDGTYRHVVLKNRVLHTTGETL